MNFTSKRPKENDTWTTRRFVAAQIKDDPCRIRPPLYVTRFLRMTISCWTAESKLFQVQ
jgi:hypothetical protein